MRRAEQCAYGVRTRTRAHPPHASPVLACGPRLRASKRRGAVRRSLQAGPAAMAQSRSLHRTLITR
jgi:hypothetical protein